MMHLIFVAMRTYPFWGLSTAVVLFQMGIFYRRKRQKLQHLIWAIEILLVLSVGLWIYFRGDKNSDLWVRQLFFMNSI